MLQYSAQELSAKIKSKELTSSDVVDFFIQRIEKVNPRINAVVESRFAEARKEAALADKKISKSTVEEISKLPPLFGVPFTVKEMISVQGHKSTLGSVHRRDQVMTRNATVVERLVNAGGIILGMTNVPEVGFWFECDNVVYGKTSNPFDLSRTSGGSSGGEGAILGAGGSPFGLGSDIGGSIRIPAAFCGIFGHKPSDKLIPFTGHAPVYHDNAKDFPPEEYPFTVLGPLARKSSDLYLLLQLLVGPDGFDQETKKNFRLKPLLKDPSEIRVHYLPSPLIHGTSKTETDLCQAVINASRYLKELGAPAHELPERILLHSFDYWTGRAWSIENKHFPSYLTDGRPLSFSKEFIKLALGQRNYTLPSLLTAFLDTYASGRSQKTEYLTGLADLKTQLTEILREDGVLILPVHPKKAPKHHATYLRPFDFSYTGIFNALGFPATAVPMGLSREGLPLSVQVVAAEDQDHLCLSIAAWLEQGFGGALLAP